MCSVIYVSTHDLPHQIARMKLAEGLAVGFATLICMSKIWDRKRVPHYLLWVLLVLSAYLFLSTRGTIRMVTYYWNALRDREKVNDRTMELLSSIWWTFIELYYH